MIRSSAGILCKHICRSFKYEIVYEKTALSQNPEHQKSRTTQKFEKFKI
jgi:hypothetical protein